MSEAAPAGSDGCAGMGRTTGAHDRFKPFVGTFRAVVRMWMGPGDPMLSTGTMTNTLELGGRYLRQSYTSDPNPGPFPGFEGRGYWGYNTTEQCYEGFWIDNACTFMQLERGQVDGPGKVWTMEGVVTNPQTGKPMKKRSVITLKDDDHHTLEMLLEGPDGSSHRSMHIEYTRA